MKRRACKRLLTAAVLCAALTVPTRAARRSVPVQIDGNPIAVSAYVERGVTYVPLRALLNTIGAWDVWWDEATGRAAAASGDTCLWADPAADTVTIDEKKLSRAGSRWKTALPMSLCGWWGRPLTVRWSGIPIWGARQ